MQQFFDMMDANGDGFVDKAEAAAALKRAGQAGGGPPGGRSATVETYRLSAANVAACPDGAMSCRLPMRGCQTPSAAGGLLW